MAADRPISSVIRVDRGNLGLDMARPLRLEFPGAVWHLTSRGNERKAIFRDDEDRLHFLQLFAMAVERYKWIVYSWMLMTNHYHLVVETTEETLSRGMQWLNSEYASWFNRKYARVGHLFQGRFKGILVDSENYLLQLSRYVAMNPVRAGMVGCVEDWKWSSYHATAGLGGVGPAILANGIETLLASFHPSDGDAAQQAYREFMHVPVETIESPWVHLRNQIFLGDDTWVADMQKRIDEAPRSSDHPKVQRHLLRPTMDHVVDAVAKALAVSPGKIRNGRGGLARMLVAHLGVYEGIHFRRTIAAALNLRSCTRVSGLVTECRRVMERDPVLARLGVAACQHLEHRPPPTPYVLRRPARDLLRESPYAGPAG